MVSRTRKPQRIKDIVEDSRHWEAEDLMRNLDDELDRMEKGMSHVIFDFECHSVTRCLRPLPVTPHFRIEESAENFEIRISLPVASKEDVHLNVDGEGIEVLVDPVDPTSRPYYLRVDAKGPLDPNGAQAEFSEGVLKIVSRKLKKARIKVR